MLEAGGTNADKLELMSDDFEIGTLGQIVGDADIEAGRGINYPAAVPTTDMVVIFRHAVKSFETAAELKLLNFAACSKNLEVAIDGSEADAGKTVAHQRRDLIGAGMGINFAKFFQDDLTLLRHPQV
jgi:hypothetical protein